MAKKILVNYDFTKNQVMNAVAHVLAADPSSPTTGQFYYDSTNNLFKYHNGTSFVSDTARSRHTGTQTASTISDFDTQVRTNRLDQMAAPTAAVSLNGQKITNLATPTASGDATTKAYVDDKLAGLSWKDEVRVATTDPLDISTDLQDGTGLDGVTLATGDRVLVKNQSAGAENGIYVVVLSGSGTRATDADSGAEMKGAAVFVSEGTTNGGTRWVCNNTGTITIDSTSLTFVSFGGGASYSAGAGLTLSGSTFNVGAGTGITVNADDVQLDTSHARNVDHTGVTLTAGNGLTGGGDISTNRTFAVGAGTGITVNADDVAINPAVVVTKYAADIGNGSNTTITVTHNLGTKDITWSVRQNSDDAFVDCECVAASTTQASFTFAVAPASNALRVVIHA